jgi:hypothetical protein
MGSTPQDSWTGVGSLSEERLPPYEDLANRSLKIDPLAPASPLQVAVNAFLRTSSEVLPVVEGASFAGVLWRENIEKALLSGMDRNAPVESLVEPAPLVFSPGVSVGEAWEALRSAPRSVGIVVDEEGRYVGVVDAFSLSSEFIPALRLPTIGGLATPLGVYLSTGYVSAGAGRLGLILAGVVLAVFAGVSLGVSYGLVVWGLEVLGLSVGEEWREMAIALLSFALFLVLLRLSPLSGVHGAEHMVVHALERGEALVPESVRRMPREHPRCGTNIMSAIVVFVILFTFLAERTGVPGALLAFIATILLWRRVGWFLQHWFTTKTPSRPQVENGIAVGVELLDKLRRAGYREVDFLEKLSYSGLPWVLLGASVAGGVLWLLVRGMGGVLRVF